MPVGVLDGVKVLDLSEDIAGSFCARLLADYGADVLKLEPPGGAALRRMEPFFGDDPHPEKSLFFLVMNLNKKGANLNLASGTGRAILKELAQHVDVVVETFRPGYLASVGLGYEDLAQLNPGLVMTSITPFGQDGPYSQYQGEEIVNYAMGMIMSISGLPGPGAVEARRVSGSVRRGPERCRGHCDGAVYGREYWSGAAPRRVHNRVRGLHDAGHSNYVRLHR